MPTYTPEEKIDYIFKELKAQKRDRIFKTLFKITILIFIFFLYFNFIHKVEKKDILNNITTVLSEITKPIVESLVQDMISNTGSSQNLDNSVNSLLKNNPELLKQLNTIGN